MQYWIVILLALTLVAGILGFGGVLQAAAGIPQVLFAIFVFLLVVSIILGAVRGRNQ
jgi:uncharacterized membrane protein YtjA (UPF0391 family)